MTRWLHVVGIGEEGIENLNENARRLIADADVVVGGERHLAKISVTPAERMTWPSPFHPLIKEIESHRGKKVVVLATGDPSYYGVAASYVKAFGAQALNIVPAPSAFSLAAARLGWSLEDAVTLSLHGRPYERLHAFLQDKAKLLLLTDKHASPQRIAATLCKLRYSRSRLTVLERLGGAEEKITSALACDWSVTQVDRLNTVAIECVADVNALVKPRLGGLADEAFEHDGQLTKREVRAVTLAHLAPQPYDCLWDVGAGCGSVAIEWLRCDASLRAYAIEKEPRRCELLRRNAGLLGTPNLNLITGQAPQALSDLPAPDAIFIGGGIDAQDVFETCWRALKPGGRLVANVVSLQGQRRLLEYHERFGGNLTQLSIARAQAIGRFHGFQPLRPVTQLAVVKVAETAA